MVEQPVTALIVPQGKILDFIDGKLRNETPEEYVRQEIALDRILLSRSVALAATAQALHATLPRGEPDRADMSTKAS